MTAPDPGLTDLIAAHRWTCSRDEDCICGWVGPFADFPTHVALVVEQHTNGRHEWPKTTPTGHTYERPTTYDELNGITADMAQGEIEGWEKTELPPEPTWPMVTLAQREIYRQSVRIAELEATIARVQKALEGVCDSCDYTDLRAALEGEQQ